MNHTILFKVVAHSTNTNSFGLRGHILISRTGLAVELALNALNTLDVNQDVRVPVRRDDVESPQQLASAVARHLHGEIPRARQKAPRGVVQVVFGQPNL
jgi:hypothetical protein